MKKTLLEIINSFLEKQNDWVKESQISALAIKEGFIYTDILAVIRELKTKSNIGYDYKQGFRFYERKEPIDTLNEKALATFDE